MQYSTFYAKLTPNGAASGTKYSVEVLGVTAIVDGQKVYGSTAMYFAIRPKSSGMATVNFINATTGDLVGTRQILVRSTTLAKPTYSLAASATTVNEGGSVTFTFDTTDVLVGTEFPYMVTGISAADLSSNNLNGIFKIGSDGIAKVTLTISEDYTTEGDETLTLTVTGKSLSKSVVVKDTSLSPTYTALWTGDSAGNSVVSTINEGQHAYLVLKTTNVIDGAVFTYEITGTNVNINDFGGQSLTGNLTISNNVANIIFRSNTDRLTEGNEIVTATIKRNGTVIGTTVLTLVDSSKSTTYNIGVYDSTTSTTELTSLTPITGGSFTIRVGQGIDPDTQITTYGYSSGHNAGSLESTSLYMNGSLITPDYADFRPGNLALQGVIFIRMSPGVPLPSSKYRVKMTNLENGKVAYTDIGEGAFVTTAISLILMTSESANNVLTNIFILNNRVKFEFEWQ